MPQRMQGLGRTTVRICDYHAIRLTDDEIATARERSQEAPEEFRDNMFGHYLCAAFVARVVTGSTIKIPKKLSHDRALAMAMAMEDRLAADSHSLEDYYKATGTDERALMSEFEEMAEEQLKSRAALLAISRVEGIAASDEEYDAEVRRLSKNYLLTAEDLDRQFRKSGEDSSIREDISIEKASNFVAKLMLEQVSSTD